MSERYKDVWRMHIPDHKLAAYKQLLDDGVITDPHVVYDRKDRTTTVEYSSELPRETILEELKKRSEANLCQEKSAHAVDA